MYDIYNDSNERIAKNLTEDQVITFANDKFAETDKLILIMPTKSLKMNKTASLSLKQLSKPQNNFLTCLLKNSKTPLVKTVSVSFLWNRKESQWFH